MEIKTKTRTEGILRVIYIAAWLVFIGFMIEAGVILVGFGISCVNPEAAWNVYKMNLHSLMLFSFAHYTVYICLKVILLLMKAYVAFLVTKILSDVNLMNPFKIEVAQILQKISYILLGASFIALANNAHTEWMAERSEIAAGIASSEGYFFMAALLYVISQVFKRGVEIQSENDLTI
jgi:Protein of unknown function (DUF2975)